MKHSPPSWLEEGFKAENIGEEDLRGRIVHTMEHILGFETITLPGKDSYSRDQVVDIPESDLPRFYNEACKHAVESL